MRAIDVCVLYCENSRTRQRNSHLSELLEETIYNSLETEVRIFCKSHTSDYGYKIPVAYDYAFLNIPEEVKFTEKDIIYIDCTLKQAIEIFKLENEVI